MSDSSRNPGIHGAGAGGPTGGAATRLGPGTRDAVWIAAVLLGGLVLRVAVLLAMPNAGFAGDLRIFTRWASALATVGPGHFYAVATQQPAFVYGPPIQYLLWPIGALGGGWSMLKLPAIGSDLVVAALLYWAGRRWIGQRGGLWAAGLYLIAPPVWYNSAAWGQFDGMLALATVLAAVLLVEGWDELALAAGVASVLVKPQGVVVLVVIVPVLIRRHLLDRREAVAAAGAADARAGGWARRWLATRGPHRLVAAVVATLVVVALLVAPFDTDIAAPGPVRSLPLVGKVVGVFAMLFHNQSLGSSLTANAFNPWALVGPSPLTRSGTGGVTDSLSVLGIPAVVIGAVLLVAACAAVAVVLLRRDGWVPIMLGLTIVSVAFFVLPTRVHERYLVPAFAPAAILAAAALVPRLVYAAAALLYTVNVHAVLARGVRAETGPVRTHFPHHLTSLGSGIMAAAWARPTIAVVAIGLTLTLVLMVVAWLRIAAGRSAWATPAADAVEGAGA